MLRFNFKPEQTYRKSFILFLFLSCIWALSFRNYYVYLSQNLASPRLTKPQPNPSVIQPIKPALLIQILALLRQLDCADCRIKRLDISPHFLLLHGQTTVSEDFIHIWQQFKTIQFFHHLEFLKWESQGVLWGFSIKAFY